MVYTLLIFVSSAVPVCVVSSRNKSRVKSVQLGRLLKLPMFVVQKAATQKNEVEFRQKFIDAIKFSLGMSYNVARHPSPFDQRKGAFPKFLPLCVTPILIGIVVRFFLLLFLQIKYDTYTVIKSIISPLQKHGSSQHFKIRIMRIQQLQLL